MNYTRLAPAIAAISLVAAFTLSTANAAEYVAYAQANGQSLPRPAPHEQSTANTTMCVDVA